MAHEELLRGGYGLIREVSGDVCEFGVGNGASIGLLGRLMQEEGGKRFLHGYDAWEGREAPEDAVAAEMAQWGVKVNWRLVKGLFADTLPKGLPKQIAFVHVDCNTYEAHMEVLKAVWPRLSAGGVMVFDDWGEPKWPGVDLAITQFFAGEERKPFTSPSRRDGALDPARRMVVKRA